jgi:hypothetical protein
VFEVVVAVMAAKRVSMQALNVGHAKNATMITAMGAIKVFKNEEIDLIMISFS